MWTLLDIKRTCLKFFFTITAHFSQIESRVLHNEMCYVNLYILAILRFKILFCSFCSMDVTNGDYLSPVIRTLIR